MSYVNRLVTFYDYYGKRRVGAILGHHTAKILTYNLMCHLSAINFLSSIGMVQVVRSPIFLAYILITNYLHLILGISAISNLSQSFK